MMGKCKNSSINGLEEGDPVYKLKLTNLKIFYILPKISNKLEKQWSKFGTGGIMSKTLLALSMAMACAFSSNAMADGELNGVSLLVYVEPTTAPFAFLEDDFTKPVGFDVDVIYELQKRLGFSLQEDRIFPLLRSDQFERMKAGQADLIAGGMSLTADRAEFMDFTPIYFNTGLVVVHSKLHTPEIKSLEDLEGKTVLVSANSSGESYVKNNLKNIKIESIANLTLGFFDVAQGKVDAIIYDYPICEYLIATMPSLQLEAVGELFAREDSQYTMGLKRDSPYTRYFFNAMTALRMDGTLDRLREKWKIK